MFFLGCYGVPPAKASEEWMCSRCSANALEEVSIPVLFPASPEDQRGLGASLFPMLYIVYATAVVSKSMVSEQI